MRKRLVTCCLAFLLLFLMAAGQAETATAAIDYSEYIFCEDIEHFTPDPYHHGQYTALGTPTPAPTGSPISVEGNAMTRDLLFDKHTNKQFVTLETRKGNPFFLVIDYDKPKDAAGEQFDTFFLNKVDEADLMGLIDDEAKEGMAKSCTCKTQCQPGAINTACPVCKTDMTECKGIAPTPTPKPTATPAVELPAPQDNKGAGIGGIVLVIILLAAGGGAFFYFRRRKGSGKGKTPAFEYDEGFEDTPHDEDETEEADDKEDV